MNNNFRHSSTSFPRIMLGVSFFIQNGVEAKTFDELFEEASNKNECAQVRNRCTSYCTDASINNSLAIIISKGKGGKNFDEKGCKTYCREAVQECNQRIDEEATAAKEAEAEKREKASQQEWAAKLAKKPPSFVLVCGRYQFKVWDGEGCGTSYPNWNCSVTTAKITIDRNSDEIHINRMTGIMERTQEGIIKESVSCQKVDAGTAKF